MISNYWNKYGFFIVVATLLIVAVLLFFWSSLFPPKFPPGTNQDLIKIITYERSIKANVINVITNSENQDIVWVMWDDRWENNDPICPYVQKHQDVSIIVVERQVAIVEVDGVNHIGNYYRAAWAIKAGIDNCISAPINLIIETPEAINWDWQRH